MRKDTKSWGAKWKTTMAQHYYSKQEEKKEEKDDSFTCAQQISQC